MNARIVPASHVLYIPGDLTQLPTIQVQMRLWLSEHHPSEASGLGRLSEIPEVVYIVAYPTDIEGKGDWDLSDLIGGLDIGHTASIRIGYK